MLKRILNVGERVKLQEFTGARQILSASVQIQFELFELTPKVSFTLLLAATAQKGWVDRKVDLQVELQLLAD